MDILCLLSKFDYVTLRKKSNMVSIHTNRFNGTDGDLAFDDAFQCSYKTCNIDNIAIEGEWLNVDVLWKKLCHCVSW